MVQNAFDSLLESGSFETMKLKDLLFFFGLEIFATIVAITVFKTIPPSAASNPSPEALLQGKQIAATIAGSTFIIVAGAMFLRMLTWKKWMFSLTFWTNAVHLFFISFPMMTVYVMNWGKGFHQAQIFGIPGAHFHILSEKLYTLLLVFTLIDAARAYLGQKKQTRASSSA